MYKIEEWKVYLQYHKQYSPHTIAAYVTDVENFFDAYSKECSSAEDIERIGVNDFRDWLGDRVARGVLARSNSRAISSLKSYFGYLIKKKHIKNSAIYTLKKPKLAKLLPKPVKQRVIQEVFYLVYDQRTPEWVKARDDALYHLLYATGLRINEALSIKIRDVGEEIYVKGKGGKHRVVPVLPSVLEKIHQYMAMLPFRRESDDYLFVGLRGRQLTRRTVESKLQRMRENNLDMPEHLSPHAFRHSFATHMVQSGADLRSVQELLGHASISTVEIYTNIDNQEILDVYRRTHPLEIENKHSR